jgi:hypothetical protein
MSVVLKVKQI